MQTHPQISILFCDFCGRSVRFVSQHLYTAMQNIKQDGLSQNKDMEGVWMDKQRDILIERLEQQLKERDQMITEMAKSSPVTGDRIAALEREVKELREDMRGILNELLDQKAIIEEIQHKKSSTPKRYREVRSAEYIVAENTPEMNPERDEKGEIIVAG